MRAGIDIDEALLQAAASPALRRGRTLQAAGEQVLQNSGVGRKAPPCGVADDLPLLVFRSGAMQRDVELSDHVALEDLMNAGP